MKKNDWILAVLVLVTAGILGMGYFLGRSEGKQVVITVDGEEVGTYSLEEEQQIMLGESNCFQIQDRTVKMIWADCPDQICVQTPAISEEQEMIVCMPHRVVAEIK